MLHHWDFNQRPVSAMAADYLASIADRPLLCIGAVNPGALRPWPRVSLGFLGVRVFIWASWTGAPQRC